VSLEIPHVGVKVKVGALHRIAERRGMVGRVVGCYGGEKYVAVDVRFPDGQHRMFWPGDLEEIAPSRPWWRRKEKPLQPDQTVFEMVEEVLTRQARALADQTGKPFERALDVVANTEAGRQLRKLANGEHRHEKARDWQASVLLERAEERLTHLVASYALPPRLAAERRYSWLEDYLESLEDNEARAEYLARLEELASLNG